MSEFERLLQERAQIQEWLERLAEAGNKTPESVRERVKTDYMKRLSEVQEELNGHRDEIVSALEKHNGERDELLGKQKEAEEKRAEAELRNTVGEFDDEKWEELRSELDGSLEKIGDELGEVDAEIAKLDKAMDSLTESPSEPPEVPEEVTESPQEEPEAESLELVDADADEAPPDLPDEIPDEPLDDLTFLKTVAEDEEPKEKAETPSAEPMPPDASETLGKPTSTGSQTAVEVGADETTTFADNTEQPKKGAAKTLKCTECGTMNLPTEWYCERCGAELAAL